MKKITSFLLMVIVGLGLMSTTASAEIKKGKNTYLKKCKKCHGNGTKGAALKTQSGWQEFFDNDAKLIIKAHMIKDVDKKTKSYFNGKRFQKKAPHLKDFLYKYGSDSGNIPSCS